MATTQRADSDLLAVVARGTAGAVGEEFFRSLVRHVALGLDADLAFVAEVVREHPGRVRLVQCWRGSDYVSETVEYETAGTPCAEVVEQAFVCYPEGVSDRFPTDDLLVRAGAEGYFALPLRSAGGEHLGHFGIARTTRLEPDGNEVAALRVFAARAAAELERRRYAEQLERSRARIVEAADAARRQLGRDLHDGAQQRLVAISQLLHLLRMHLDRDLERARDFLEQASEQVSLANEELRAFAGRIHPAAIGERGLEGALVALAQRSPLPVEVLGVPGERLPESSEVAAYYVASEGVTNAADHASAQHVTIRAELLADRLVIEVADDGIGGAHAASGSGLERLADRVEAVGGRLTVDSPRGGGTRLVATLPAV